jgi:hypothetical protein
MDFGSSGFAEREVKFREWDCISAPELLGVLGTGARISVDILELGSYLVGREERFWAVFYGAASGQEGIWTTEGY